MSLPSGQDRLGVDPTFKRRPGAERAPSLSFDEAIKSGPLVLDAGMGTRLIALGLDPRSDDPALWNLARPDQVLAIHRQDIAAGSGAILTNTFGANRLWLRKFGQSDAVETINRRAVALARAAAGWGRFVMGELGPTAAREEGAAVEQAAILVDAGADVLILETYRFREAERVLREVSRSLAVPIPVVASLWEWPVPVGPAARQLLDAGATVIGMNCQPGIDAAVAFAGRLDGQVRCPLLVKPGAGSPDRPDHDPASFAAAVPRLLERNVRLLGGCCGTTSAHVAALAAACAEFAPCSSSSLPGETR
jgi:5-methyltetrahydrofolate--homocysteine methyltransferase